MVDSLTVQASWINDAEFIGYFVGMSRGFYREEGLEIVHLPGHAGLVPERVLIEGRADIALTSPDFLAATIASTGADLRIVGAQFQKNPLGIVSLASHPIATIGDVRGKTLAIPDLNRSMVLDLFAGNGIGAGALTVKPYHHEIELLARGEVDGVVDFIVDGQFKLKQIGLEPHAVLLHEFGATLFNNVAVVRTADLEGRRDALVRWLRASRRGWMENAVDLAHYPLELRSQWLDKSRSLEQEVFANAVFAPLVASAEGPFAMNAEQIAQNLGYLSRLGTPLARENFDTGLLAEAMADGATGSGR